MRCAILLQFLAEVNAWDVLWNTLGLVSKQKSTWIMGYGHEEEELSSGSRRVIHASMGNFHDSSIYGSSESRLINE
jgi:hypothetical protein